MEPRFNPNRVSLALTYALLEWTLISLLFLNSLFSYLITKFALYFKLKPPCLLCSRIDHIFEPHNSHHQSYKSLICEHHSAELSKSGPCLGVLGGTQLGSLVPRDGFMGDSDSVLEPKREGVICAYENEVVLPQQHLDFYIDNDYYGLIPVEFVGGSDQEKGGPVWRETDDELVFEPKIQDFLNRQEVGGILRLNADVERILEEDVEVEVVGGEVGRFPTKQGQGEETKRDVYLVVDGDKSPDDDQATQEREVSELDVRITSGDFEDVCTEESDLIVFFGNGDVHVQEESSPPPPTITVICEASTDTIGLLESGQYGFVDVCKEESDEFVVEKGDVHPEESSAYCHEEALATTVVICEASDTIGLLESVQYGKKKTGEEGETCKEIKCDEACHRERDEFGIENGNVHVEEPSTTDTSGLLENGHCESNELVFKNGDVHVEESSASCHEEAPSTTVVICEASTDKLGLLESDQYGSKKTEGGEIGKEKDCNEVCYKQRDEFGIESGNAHVVEPSTSVICEASTDTSGVLENGHCESKKIKTGEEGESGKENERNEVEEDRAPDTPTSIDSLQLLHRKLLLLGRSKMAKEESVDGSVVDDLEYGDGEVTIEELKLELRAERKALRALYEELEEERNAAAISASHTMAMINRLQEDKAIIEMEALQYQRMMDEQAEYDQEALQLMNEILVKREREKEEVERELEVSMKKLMDYEEREIIIQGKDTTSSAFSSNKESDELSSESNNGSKENGHHDISADAILSLKDSLSSFEEERISILEQLKVLEDNLCMLAEEEDHQIRNMKTFELFCPDNGEGLSQSFKLNGDANGSVGTKGEHRQVRTTNGSKPKQLLPLLDEAAIGSDNESSDEDEGRLDPFLLDGLPMSRFESEKRRFTIEEEVERLYERLQALEADREFIKHCFGTLRKGDRGIYLLQEILQHLRDLKNVEFRARNFDGLC